MNNVFRHDVITLHQGVKKEEFEKFMKEELFPLFSQVFKGPTRSSKADLQSQSLLSDAKGHKYIWVTEWDGNTESVHGSTFEHTRMNRVEGMRKSDAALKKLEGFGTRATEKLFLEIDHTDVAATT